MEILPWRVTVVKDAVFSMRAHVRDQWGISFPDERAEEVRWKADGYLVVPGSPGATVTITAQSGGATLPVSTELTAYVGSVIKKATITIVELASASSPQLDWIANDHVAKDAPTIVLADGVVTESDSHVLRADTMIAFVREAGLDALDCPDGSNCGEVAIFSPQHAIARRQVKWESRCEFVSATAAVTAPPSCADATLVAGPLKPLGSRVVLRVFVWNASNIPDIEIQEDVNFARRVLNDPWAGLSLDVVLKARLSPRYIGYNDTLGCHASGSDLVAQFPDISSGEFQQKRITVVYVDEINPGDGSISGFTCAHHASRGTIIVLSKNADGSSKLAHELGHALGQWRPPAPIHTNGLLTPFGVDPSNLMWSSEVDDGGGPRRFLTLGQIFQVSFSKASFMNTAQLTSTEKLPCAGDPASNSPCPPLAKDALK